MSHLTVQPESISSLFGRLGKDLIQIPPSETQKALQILRSRYFRIEDLKSTLVGCKFLSYSRPLSREEMISLLEKVDQCRKKIGDGIEACEQLNIPSASSLVKVAVRCHLPLSQEALLSSFPQFQASSSLLHLAAEVNNVPAVGILTAQSADPNGKRRREGSLSGRESEGLFDINERNANDYTPLETAFLNSSYAAAGALLDKGADPNGSFKPSDTGEEINRPPLAYCIERMPKELEGQEEREMVLTKLLEKGALINCKYLRSQVVREGFTQRTPLCTAADCGASLKVMELLLRFGANINEEIYCQYDGGVVRISEDRQTALDLAIEEGSHECVQFLKGRGALTSVELQKERLQKRPQSALDESKSE